jgi:hypothetical protein
MKTIIYYDDTIEMNGRGIQKITIDREEVSFNQFFSGLIESIPSDYWFSPYLTAISNAGGVTIAFDYDSDTPDEDIECAYNTLAQYNIEWRAI